jgi:hypothetical protein
LRKGISKLTSTLGLAVAIVVISGSVVGGIALAASSGSNDRGTAVTNSDDGHAAPGSVSDDPSEAPDNEATEDAGDDDSPAATPGASHSQDADDDAADDDATDANEPGDDPSDGPTSHDDHGDDGSVHS